MRETRFYEYQNDSVVQSGHLYEVSSLKHWNANTSYSIPYSCPPVVGGGLAGSIIAWRIDSGSTIVLENLLDRTSTRIAFPSTLSCLPVVKTREKAENILVVASFVKESGCELVLLHCNFPDTSASSENVTIQKTQLALDANFISVLHSSESSGELFYGLASGQCGLITLTQEYPASLELTQFEAPASSEDGEDSDTTASTTTEFSRNSTNSAMSKSFISRLMTTPRMLLPSPGGQNVARARTSTNTPVFRGSLPFASPHASRTVRNAPPAPLDPIEALLSLELDEPCLVALHALGKIVVYAKHGNQYQLGGEGKFPVVLAKDQCRQFLLKESHGKIVAVLTVDEDPQPNSIRVFSVSLKQQITKAIVISVRPLVKRQGPIDRIVGAVFFGGNIVVGSESGAVSGSLNSNDVEENGIGLPISNMWTAIDDIERPNGFGNFVKSVTEDVRERLLAAHRFSPEVLAKAVRLLDVSNCSRVAVEKRIRVMTFGENEEENCNRAVSRAERLTIDLRMPLQGLQIVSGVGLVAARRSGLFVFRKMKPVEAQVLRRNSSIVEGPDMLSGPVAWLSASQAAVQTLCADLVVLEKMDPSYKNLEFMVRQSLLFSEVSGNTAMTDRIVMDKARQSQINMANSGNVSMGTEFWDAVEHVRSTLEPGGKSLKFLYHAKEMNALRLAAEFSADYVPMSSYFSSGLSWLKRYRTVQCALKGEDTIETDEVACGQADSSMLEVSSDNANTLLERAYGNLVSAAKFAETNKTERCNEDLECVLDLAKLSSNSSSEDENAAMRLGNDDDSPLAGVGKDAVVEHLGYWLLERSVRLLESSGSPKTAAAAALEAMRLAPDRDRYETMRAAAFGRFLDAGGLNFALSAQLQPPFDVKTNEMCSKDEADALRDAMGLFVNAVADKDQLAWLIEYNLPEPLKSLSAMTLERRARAGEPINVDVELNVLSWSSEEPLPRSSRKLSDYEYLYSWYVANTCYQKAATCALEWAERLSSEGLVIVGEATIPKTGRSGNEARLRLLLAWTRMKVKAYSFALSSAQLLKPDAQYFARSKFSVLAQSTAGAPGVVSLDWVLRRQLLAFAQSLCLSRMVSNRTDDEGSGTVSYLLAHGAPYLQETVQSVRWAISTLTLHPTSENVQVCAELASAWTQEYGPEQLVSVIESAARVAADSGEKGFSYSELHNLLSEVRSMSSLSSFERNWALVALKSALSASAGSSIVPQWLVEEAAWGGNESARGDVGGVARTFLMFNQPVDAAKVLLSEFRRARNNMKVPGDATPYERYQRQAMPYSAIDTTLKTLSLIEESDSTAVMYRERLAEETRMYSVHAQDEFLKCSGKANGDYVPVR